MCTRVYTCASVYNLRSSFAEIFRIKLERRVSALTRVSALMDHARSTAVQVQVEGRGAVRSALCAITLASYVLSC